jgi:hypothetical protein
VDPLLQLDAAERGVPAEPGETVLEISDGVLTATSSADGTEIIRTTARVGDEIAGVARGQLRYITDVDGTLTSGLYPFVLSAVTPWEVLSFEFLEPDHPVSALRPADPLQVTWGFYSPSHARPMTASMDHDSRAGVSKVAQTSVIAR